MTGLEDRLRRVRGVADLTIELGEEGLESIRVRIDDESEESSVLEEIRRILVAYGLRSRRPDDEGFAAAAVSAVVGEDEAVSRPRIAVGPRGSRLVVRLSDGDREVERTGERSPVGVAEAMMKAVAGWNGTAAPERFALAMDELDGVPVVTMLARSEGRVAVASASCAVSMVGGMYTAADRVLEELTR